MRILALGDVVGACGVSHLRRNLRSFCERGRVDFTVVNAENASEVRGVSVKDAVGLLESGADFLTLGNHAFGMRDLYPFLDAHPDQIIRPANFPPVTPGSGYSIVPINGWRILIANVCGRVNMTPCDDPFAAVERILEREEGKYDFSILDIHAEATSEKLALAYAFDGRVTVLFGTHTHVPTADARVLPHGSGYVTDLGMCGSRDGIIGTNAEDVLARFRTGMPTRLRAAETDPAAEGVIFDVDESAARVRSVERIEF